MPRMETVYLAMKLIVLAIWGLSIVTTVSSFEQENCRCLATDDCWPTSSKWDEFNATVGGRLIAPKPTGYPCHDAHFDAATCEIVRANSTEPHWRATNAGSAQWDHWEAKGRQECNWEAPGSSRCRQGRVSLLGVQVQNAGDVQKAVKFAATHNLRLAVKSTGHDYLGRSSAAGSFLIWMHKLKSITITDSFTTTCGTNTSAAVTVAGGVMWDEIYDAIKDTGYAVVGGICLTVCASGGYFQGGGHSVFGPLWGLAVDNVLQIDVVTADGSLHTVNACQDPELFFALRGGGGGTFGVVTSVTFKLHRTPPNLVGPTILLSPSPNSSIPWSLETQEEILTVYAQHTGELDAANWGGYWTYTASFFNLYFLVPGTPATANATMAPLLDALARIEGVVVTAPITNWAQDWRSAFDYLSTMMGVRATGGQMLLGTRILPYSALQQPRGVAKAILSAKDASKLGAVGGAAVIGPGVRGADPHGLTSVTPAWRNGALLLISLSPWTWNATDGEKSARNATLAFAQSLRSSYPDSGTYFNEASIDEPDWKQSFWGKKNYAKLLAIKARVDPKGLFVCRKCVGSELWREDGNCKV
ncbi:hypothetical protein M758_6G049800 [Ceratodon purpureus]|nr:hypothetical protein M758_6G049800 [Ceratodon purpureus]